MRERENNLDGTLFDYTNTSEIHNTKEREFGSDLSSRADRSHGVCEREWS